MDLKNKIILITGATSGIGKALAYQAAELGANLILLARREERLESLKQELVEKFGVKIALIKADIRDRELIKTSLNNLPNDFKNINILINNAGLGLTSDLIQKGELDNWDIMIDTNIKGLLNMINFILPGMLERKSGHIVNIGSVAGHDCYPGGNVYCATKHAVRALSKSLRLDLLGTGLRVTDIAPGAVHTEFSEVRWGGDKKKSDDFYAQFNPLKPEDIADNIIYVLTRPPHVNIAEIVIYPTDQASPNHLYKSKI